MICYNNTVIKKRVSDMTKRKGADSEETKAAILFAAAEEFYEYGYEKSSLRRICSRAGVTTGAIYCFYSSKEDLLSNVMKPVFGVVSSISVNYGDILSDDFTSFAEFQKFFSANRKLYQILYNNMSNPAVADYLAELNAEFGRQVVKLALSCLPEGSELPKELDSYITGFLAHLMVYSIVKMIAEEEDDELVKSRLVTVIRVYKNGILSLLK